MKILMLFSLNLLCLIKNSKKKIMIIISMELMMLTMLMFIMEFINNTSMNTSILIMFSIIMVTESIMSMTILILNFRNSDKLNMKISTWT